MRHESLRHDSLCQYRPLRYLLTTLFLTLLLGVALPVAPRATAQSLDTPIIGYGASISGAVDSPSGIELLFTGCAGETISLAVETDGFAPRLQLFAPDVEEALANVAAADNTTSASIDDLDLTTSGLYIIVVNGRSRADRGEFDLTLEGDGPDNPEPDDSRLPFNLLYGEHVEGSIEPANDEQWNFRGCAGDEIRVELVTDGFVPQLDMSVPFAELPIETADVEAIGNEATATLRHTLPHNGPYTLQVVGVSDDDAGDYALDLTLEGRTEVLPVTPTTIVEETPTAVAGATPTATSSGPRGRRGVPTPATSGTPSGTPAATPTATRQPSTPTAIATPTPGFIMPGIGDEAFRIIDVSSETGPINHAAYSPDGSLVATAGEDGAVRVWDTLTGELLQTLDGHEDRVNYIDFAPDDSLIASAGSDGAVRLWDQVGRQAALLEMPDDIVNSVEFSPDSTLVVATTSAGDVLVWDVADESVLYELEPHQGEVYHATFSPDGAQIASGDSVGTVRLWDVETGTLADSLPVNAGPGSGDPVLSIAFSSDSTAIVVGGVEGVNDATVQVWDLITGDPIAGLLGHSEWGSTASISPDDAYILSAGRAEPDDDRPLTSTARIWNTETGELAVALVGYSGSVVAATFNPDGSELLTSDGMYLYFWPEPMLDVFAATFGEAVGVQVPEPNGNVGPVTTPTPRATPTRAAPTATPTATSAVTTAPTPTRTPAVTATPTPFFPTTQLEIFCTVTTDRLNLRPGPGTEFNPPIDVLLIGDLLVVVGRNEDSSWLQVAVLDENLNIANTGWVSTDFVFCVGDIDDAPVVEVES